MQENILLKQFQRSVTASVKEVAKRHCIFLYRYMPESPAIAEKLTFTGQWRRCAERTECLEYIDNKVRQSPLQLFDHEYKDAGCQNSELKSDGWCQKKRERKADRDQMWEGRTMRILETIN